MGESPQRPRRGRCSLNLEECLGDLEVKVTLDPTPRGASLILAKLPEAQATVYVMRAPSVEEAVWFARVVDAVFILAGGSPSLPYSGSR